LLRQGKFLRRCAAGKPVIHASRSGNDTLKDQVTDKGCVRCMRPNVDSSIVKRIVHFDGRQPLSGISQRTTLRMGGWVTTLNPLVLFLRHAPQLAVVTPKFSLLFQIKLHNRPKGNGY
jgi:hypothetical protein